MAERQHAYNSLWQARGDAWCRLDEAADRLARPTTTGALKDKYVGICRDLLQQLTPLEPYWAYPGTPQFARLQRLFHGGQLRQVRDRGRADQPRAHHRVLPHRGHRRRRRR